MDAWYLRHTESGHNKHYMVWIVPAVPNLYEVNTGWGKIGAAVQTQVEQRIIGTSAARLAAEELVRRKISRGYRLVWTSGSPSAYPTWEQFCKYAHAPKGEINFSKTPVPFVWTSGTANPVPATPTRRRKPKATVAEEPKKKEKAKEEKVVLKRHDADWNF
jgi:predicted DNA-binding WGR domain protein